MNKTFKKVLIKVAKKLNKNNIDWLLIGTTNHLLQGMDKNPNDIDVLIKKKDLQKVKKIFSNYNPSQTTKTELGNANFKFKINNISIEVIESNKIKKYFKNKKKFIINKKVKGTTLPCRKLKEELKMYKKLNRTKRIKEIEEELNYSSLDK